MKIWACAEPKTLFEGFRSGAWIRKMRECGIEGFLVLSVDVSREIPVEDIRRVKGLLEVLFHLGTALFQTTLLL